MSETVINRRYAHVITKLLKKYNVHPNVDSNDMEVVVTANNGLLAKYISEVLERHGYVFSAVRSPDGFMLLHITRRVIS